MKTNNNVVGGSLLPSEYANYASTVTPSITSASQSLQQQSAITVSDGAFTFEVPAQSVVTFAGTKANASVSLGGLATLYDGTAALLSP